MIISHEVIDTWWNALMNSLNFNGEEKRKINTPSDTMKTPFLFQNQLLADLLYVSWSANSMQREKVFFIVHIIGKLYIKLLLPQYLILSYFNWSSRFQVELYSQFS